jgi:hypothetical protein
MKVSVADFEIHLTAFLKDIAAAMPSGVHKFAIGVLMAANMKKIEEFLVSTADKEGNIDLDTARTLIESGFSTSGGSLVIAIPAIPLLGLQSVNLTFTKQDSDKFFDGFTTYNQPNQPSSK